MSELSRDVVLWSGAYTVLLLVLGVLARQARRRRDLSDHFLAGRNIGFFVLLLTLFATQYSGNSLSGFPGKTWRDGLSYFMCVTFMVGIVCGYMLFAPRLYALSRERRYLTPTDFLADRFGSPWLNLVATSIFCLALCNYMLAQLMAIGHAFSGLTEGQIPYGWGVVGAASVILVYELLGGMRAVAWTDALQGLILAVGVLVVLVLLLAEVGSPATVVARVSEVAPEKVASPSMETCVLWLSNFLLLGLGAPLYPQAIQRIYAARRLGELRRALATMSLLPLVAITAVVTIGVVGIALFPDLDPADSDRITFMVLGHLMQEQPAAYYPALIVMMAVIAAIMSTADSCLLSLASMFTKDFAARMRGLSDAEAERMTGVSRVFSIAIMTGLVWVALGRPTTLWGLLVIKFEILIQLSPAFVLGTLHDADDDRAYGRREILAGLIVGLAVALVLYSTGNRVVYGMHAGTIGVVVNYLTCWLGRRLGLGATTPAPAEA